MNAPALFRDTHELQPAIVRYLDGIAAISSDQSSFQLLAISEARQEGDRAEALLLLRESATGGQVYAGAWLVRQQEDWEVGDACILVAPELPPSAHLVALTQAEYAFASVDIAGSAVVRQCGSKKAGPQPADCRSPVPAAGPRPPAALLLSFRRRFRSPDVPILALPESRFTCRSRGECCRVGCWAVGLSTATRRAVEAIDWPSLGGPPASGFAVPEEVDPLEGTARPGEETSSRPPFSEERIAPDAEGNCHFLTADRRCFLHCSLGWQPIPACHLYPYYFIHTPDGVCVSASFACRTVAENQGERCADQIDELRSRYRIVASEIASVGEQVPVFLHGPSLTWKEYREIEMLCLERLDERALPLPLRLWQAYAHTCRRLIELCPEVFAGAAWSDELDDPGPPLASLEAADRLMDEVLIRNQDLPPQDPRWLSGSRWEAWEMGTSGRVAFTSPNDLLTRYLRQVLYRKRGLNRFGVTFAFGTLAWTYRGVQAEACSRAAQRGEEQTNGEDTYLAIRRLEELFFHGHYLRALTGSSTALSLISAPAVWRSLCWGEAGN